MGENGMEPSTPVLSEEQRVEVRRRLDCCYAVAMVPLMVARQDADDQIKEKDKLARSRISLLRLAAWLGAVLVLVFGIGQAQAAGAPANVDSQRIINADRDVANWLSYGRTYGFAP